MNAGRGTTGCQELEVRRRERAFCEISKSWWWFENTASLDCINNPVEWQWELLRRSNAYRKFYEKADAIRVQDETDRSLKGFLDSATSLAKLRTLAASYSRMGSNDPCHRWTDLFLARCAPNFWWTALLEESRKALSAARPLYPRSDYAEKFGGQFGIVQVVEPLIVERSPSGHENLTFLGDYMSDVISGRLDSTRILPHQVNFGAYIVFVFDSRFTERIPEELETNGTQLLQRQVKKLCAWFANQKSRQTLSVKRKSDDRIVPSNIPYWCQAWIQTDATLGDEDQPLETREILSRFHTLSGSRRKRQWLPECERAWRNLVQSYARDSLAPVKAKPARVDDPKQFYIGLCAFDWRKIEPRFSPQGFLIPFLEKFPSFENAAKPSKLRDSMKQIRRLVDSIDSFYFLPSTRA